MMTLFSGRKKFYTYILIVLISLFMLLDAASSSDVETLKKDSTRHVNVQELNHKSVTQVNKKQKFSKSKKHHVLPQTTDLDRLQDLILQKAVEGTKVEVVEVTTNDKKVSQDTLVNQETQDAKSDSQDTHATRETQDTKVPQQGKKSIFVLRKQDHFHYEVLFFLYLFVFVWFRFHGKKKNAEIVDKVTKRYSELYKSQFYTVSDSGDLQFFRQSTSSCLAYVSGRNNCYGMVTELVLKHRQDPLYALYDWGVGGTTDKFVISIALREMSPFVFAILRKTNRRSYCDDHADLKNLTPVEMNVIPGNDFVYLTDTPYVIPEIFKGGLLDTLKKCSHLVETIHFSDISQVLYPDLEKQSVLRFDFLLPQKESDFQYLDKLLAMLFDYIDYVSKMKLPDHIVQNTLDWRKTRPKDGTRTAKVSSKQKQRRTDAPRKPHNSRSK